MRHFGEAQTAVFKPCMKILTQGPCTLVHRTRHGEPHCKFEVGRKCICGTAASWFCSGHIY